MKRRQRRPVLTIDKPQSTYHIEHVQNRHKPANNAQPVQNEAENPLANLLCQYNSDSDTEDPKKDVQKLDDQVNDFFKEIQLIAPERPTCNVAKDANLAAKTNPQSTHHTSQSLWQECYDKSSGYPYYWHVETDEVTWEMPEELLLIKKQSEMESVIKPSVQSPHWVDFSSIAYRQSQANIPEGMIPQEVVARNRNRFIHKETPKKSVSDSKAETKHESPTKDDDSDDGRIEMITSFGSDGSDSEDENNSLDEKKTSTLPSEPGNSNSATYSKRECEIGPAFCPTGMQSTTRNLSRPYKPDSAKAVNISNSTNLSEQSDESRITESDSSNSALQGEKEFSTENKNRKDISKHNTAPKLDINVSLVPGYGDDSDVEEEVKPKQEIKPLFPISQDEDYTSTTNVLKDTAFTKSSSNVQGPDQSNNGNGDAREAKGDHEKTEEKESKTDEDKSKTNIFLEDMQVCGKAFQRKKRIAFDVTSNKVKQNNVYHDNVTQDDSDSTNNGATSRNDDGDAETHSASCTEGPKEVEETHEETEQCTSTKSEEKLSSKEESCDSEAAVEHKPASNPVEERTNEEMNELSQIITEKLKFLSEGRESISAVQTMQIQLQTLSTAWGAGSLEENYFQKWLTNTNHELERLEQDAAPAGWLCQWDRATSAAAYQTGQAGYAVTPAATAATYTQRPAAAAATGYETYQAAAAAAATGTTYAAANPGTVAQTYDYGYGRAAPAATYDATKTYYQQPAAAAATYTTTETHYQAAKPAYSTTSAYTGTARQATTTGQAKTYQASSTAYQQSNPTQSATYSSGYTAPATPAAAPSTATNKTASTTYSGYDAALYSAATMYVAQQSANSNSTNQKTGGWQGYGRKGFGAGGGGMKTMRPKQPPKPQQLHYCDVCKISCAGPQTYREHLEGQKHKKKEASLKVPQQPPARGAGNSLRCELCDVTCTGNDAYAAHIRGAKHQKVVKLHTKLGKPIPSADPTVLNPKPAAAAKAAVTKKATVTATPKINFVASGNLGTVNQNQTAEIKQEEPATEEAVEETAVDEKDIQPVGQEYIEENKSEDGKIISFNCKLCECRFNDPNAKDMHMKGRRHRFAYKKKVNPDLVVDMKPSLKQRKMLEEKLRRQQIRDEYLRRREEINQLGPMGPMHMDEDMMMYWEERRRYEEECEYFEWYRRYGRGPGPAPIPRGPFAGPPGPMMMYPGPQRRPDSSDDKHVLAHHTTIYPKEQELLSVQKIVSHTEKALKYVSDSLAEAGKKTSPANTNSNATTPAAVAAPQTNTNADALKKEEADKKKATTPQKEDGSDGNLFSFQKEKEDSRILRGVMRVGNLAKGLLLSGDNHVCLVVLCAEKPTRALLNKVAEILPGELKNVAPEETYNVGKHPESAALTVSGGTVTVSVTLTSPLMRETPKTTAAADNAGQQQQEAAQLQTTPAAPAVTKADPPDVLPKAKCLEALAALRHAKWFQARATSLQSCVMVIRIMRDLCNRVPTWGPLNPWALELLTEKVISTAGCLLSPGEALRRLLECVAGGILLPGSPGLSDPCEKEAVDAIGNMTSQQREDITASAQHALRLVAFRQIHKVLGMEQLPPPKFKGRFARKRRRDNSNGEGTDSEASKKDKKAEEIKMETDSK